MIERGKPTDAEDLNFPGVDDMGVLHFNTRYKDLKSNWRVVIETLVQEHKLPLCTDNHYVNVRESTLRGENPETTMMVKISERPLKFQKIIRAIREAVSLGSDLELPQSQEGESA